ncbi:MAG: DUF4296 domain-containing protein [Omnitrophica WOR_2 bacterium]
MKAVSLILGLLFMQLMINCTRIDQVKIAKDEIIDKETMVHLMADMDLTEAALKIRQDRISRDSLKLLSARAYDSLYLFYKTTPRLFKENLRYYQEDIELYKQMTDEKVTILSQKRDSIALKPEVLDTTKIKAEISKVKELNSTSVQQSKDLIDKKQIQKKEDITKPSVKTKAITIKRK